MGLEGVEEGGGSGTKVKEVEKGWREWRWGGESGGWVEGVEEGGGSG